MQPPKPRARSRPRELARRLRGYSDMFWLGMCRPSLQIKCYPVLKIRQFLTLHSRKNDTQMICDLGGQSVEARSAVSRLSLIVHGLVDVEGNKFVLQYTADV